MTVSELTRTGISVWNIDSSHSSAGFAVKHLVFSTIRGGFSDVTGSILLDENDFERSSVEAVIGVSSISTGDQKRDEHLRSSDFFTAAEHATITFKSTSVSPLDHEHFTVTGDLTISGVTRQVALDAEMAGRGTSPWGTEVMGFSATTSISRKDFGLEYNMALESGGLMIGDQVKITLDVESILQ